MTVHCIFVSSERRTSGHRGDFVVDTSKEFARFDSRRVIITYATAGVYGLAHDVPYVRRKHLFVEVDFDFVKRLGSMRFRLRRCASEFRAVDDFSLVNESDDLEAWAFQVVFWEPRNRDVVGHELRVSIDSLTELHLQLRDAVSLALLDPLEFQPGYVMSLVFYRTKKMSHRAFVSSIGSSGKSAVQAAFDGALLSTHFPHMGGGRSPIRRGPIEVFLENVSAIHRDAGASSLGRRPLEDSWIDFAGVGAGTDAELHALISVLIKPEMTISSALLYVNSTNTNPGTSTADITIGISGSSLT
eukprot:jgi/Tetstr1/449680/TSEL_036748.t1